MEKSLVLYHGGCWDGFCAAWIARKALKEIEAVPVSYGQEPPNVEGREVFILDFSYPRETLLRMKDDAGSLQVLDHHKTAQNALEGLDDFCLFDMNKSGGRLTWEWFFGDDPIHRPAPWLVAYTEDRDLWRHALPFSREVNAALRSYPLDFTLWDGFSNLEARHFVTEGEAILRREQQFVNDHISHATEIQLAGQSILAVNATVLQSEIAGELAKGRPFGAVYFDTSVGKRIWSLRSDPKGMDVSQIAKIRGGGGHPHAAGYEEKIKEIGFK